MHVEKSDFFEAGRAIYKAGNGESNKVTFAFDDRSQILTITDSGATITPGDHCQSTDAHTVRCDSPPISFPGAPDFVRHFAYLDVSLGDGGDRVAGSASRAVRLSFDGGSGSDVMVGADSDDTLDGGGGGRDELHGGDGADVLTDGDASGSGDGDVLDGGPGTLDVVSYGQRSAGVTVDLERGNGGEVGEGDVLSGLDGVTTGSGPDRVTGSAATDTLQTGDGADVVDGRDGADQIAAGTGRDRIVGGPGHDLLDGGPDVDAPACGAGVDTVQSTTRGELLDRRCEVLSARAAGTSFSLPSQPLAVTRRVVSFAAACYSSDGEEPVPCSGTLKLREAGGRHRLLGRAKFSTRRARIVRARPNALGRRLVSRRGGVVADVSYRERSEGTDAVGKADWALRLRRGR